MHSEDPGAGVGSTRRDPRCWRLRGEKHNIGKIHSKTRIITTPILHITWEYFVHREEGLYKQGDLIGNKDSTMTSESVMILII